MNEKARKLLCGFVLIQPFLDFDFFYEGRLATVPLPSRPSCGSLGSWPCWAFTWLMRTTEAA